jgi:hypothetical protein
MGGDSQIQLGRFGPFLTLMLKFPLVVTSLILMINKAERMGMKP